MIRIIVILLGAALSLNAYGQGLTSCYTSVHNAGNPGNLSPPEMLAHFESNWSQTSPPYACGVAKCPGGIGSVQAVSGTQFQLYGSGCVWISHGGPYGNGTCSMNMMTCGGSCASAPAGMQMYDQQEPAPECIDGCEYEATTGTCDPDSGLCLFNTEATGSTCDFVNAAPSPDQTPDPELPVNCIRNNETGEVACDCASSNASWCQVPPGQNQPGDPLPGNCYWSGTIVYCPPGTPPPNPDQPPNNDQTPGNDNPGSSQCNPGDENCFNQSGNPCEAGDTNCTVGKKYTCDPTREQCQPGQGSASVSNLCGSRPSCSGDAIQCAILVQSWTNTCMVWDLKGNDPPWDSDDDYGRDMFSEATETDLEAVFNPAFDFGACPPNPTFVAMGVTVEFPMNLLCDAATVVRFFIIGAALLLALSIVFRTESATI